MMNSEEVAYMVQGEGYYLFDEELFRSLCEAFQHLPVADAQSVLDKTLFVRYVNGEGSWHLSADLIRGRCVVVLDPADLQTPEGTAITILHEAAHSVLGHSASGNAKRRDVYLRQEDEAWTKVREWLPERFHREVDRHEANGGGTNGLGAGPSPAE